MIDIKLSQQECDEIVEVVMYCDLDHLDMADSSSAINKDTRAFRLSVAARLVHGCSTRIRETWKKHLKEFPLL